MNTSRVSAFIKQFSDWASGQPGILAVILVGSQARGEAKPDSDIDLILICQKPEALTSDANWTTEFGKPLRKAIEDWGPVTSLRVWYEGGLEVEFGITDEEWANGPLDAGTGQVVDHGYRILVDKSGKVSLVLARHSQLG